MVGLGYKPLVTIRLPNLQRQQNMWPRGRDQVLLDSTPANRSFSPLLLKRQGLLQQLQFSYFCRKITKAHFAVPGCTCQDKGKFIFWKSLLLLICSWGPFSVETRWGIISLERITALWHLPPHFSLTTRWEKSNALVGFHMKGRAYLLTLRLKKRESIQFEK